jgi:hypothetical protein
MINLDIRKTVENLMALHPQFQVLDAKEELVVLATNVNNEFSRVIYTVEPQRLGYAVQRVNEENRFVTQHLPLPVADLTAAVVVDVEEVQQAQETVVSEPTKKSQ